MKLFVAQYNEILCLIEDNDVVDARDDWKRKGSTHTHKRKYIRLEMKKKKEKNEEKIKSVVRELSFRSFVHSFFAFILGILNSEFIRYSNAIVIGMPRRHLYSFCAIVVVVDVFHVVVAAGIVDLWRRWTKK